MRASIGSAAALGLAGCSQPVSPTTCYLLQGKGCRNRCSFCAQHKNSPRLSRIEWPEFDEEDILKRISGDTFKRVCLQCTDINIGKIESAARKTGHSRISVHRN